MNLSDRDCSVDLNSFPGVSGWSRDVGAPGLAVRLEEAATAMHPLGPIRCALVLFGGLAAAMLIGWPACAAWMVCGWLLEIWSWFATRDAFLGKPTRLRTQVNFAANYLVMNLWWVLLSGLFWNAGGIAGHACGAIVALALAAVLILLFYNVPAMFLAAGAAPALGALSVVALGAGMSWFQLLPMLISLGMGLIFCLGRAMDTPSAQESNRKIKYTLNQFEVLAENVPDLIARFDLEGRYVYASPASFAVLGYAPEEMVGRPVEDFVRPEDVGAITKVIRSAIADPTSRHVLTGLTLHKDGRWLSMQSTIKVILENNTAVGVIAVSRDVTERVAVNAALQAAKDEADAANRVKSEFLANVSHEFRTPLNGIMGTMQLLRTEKTPESGQRLLDQAVNCCEVLNELVNDVLDLSETEAGQLQLRREAFDAVALIEGVSAVAGPQVVGKGLSFETFVESQEVWMLGDPVRLRQILFKLIGNAAKFTHKGGVVVRLTGQGVGEARRLRLQVEDSGIGLSEETKAALFGRFHQADSSSTRKFGGVGLGLAIVGTLTNLMGGEIGIQSVEGEGSTFWIDLPAPEIAVPQDQEENGALLEGLRILVVEDNCTNRLIATKLLENLGASVETAENGALGVEALQSREFDLVFMDIQMPVMDGMSATKAIRALPAPACEAPIIAVTANTLPRERAEYERIGMNGLIAKPLSANAIIAEIARLAA